MERTHTVLGVKGKRRLRRSGAAVLVAAVLTAIGPCTFTHRYGPYHGRVTEKETGQPIQGALVLMVFYTEMYTPGGFTSHFVDAFETATDVEGEFNIPARRLWAFRFPHQWDDIAPVTIFKPSYGVYAMRFIPQDEHVTIQLPKLRTWDERSENLAGMIPANVPEEKLKNLLELRREEAKVLGIPGY